jgi:hypothetical protein
LELPKTRRAILKAAGALSALAALPVRAQIPSPVPAATPTPSPAKKPDGLARVARERYGKFLTEDEMARMDEDMAFLDTRSTRLRAIRLENGAEPALDFRVNRT